MERIGVFLSSNSDIDPAYVEAALRLGQWIGQQGKTLVYGGNAMGLMEQLAQSVRKNGGHVVGVIPQGAEYGHMHVSDAVDTAFYCANMADRKQTLLQESDILVALPGGIGTLDEVLSVVAAATVGEHTKRVLLYNVGHCWDSFLHLLDDLRRQKLIYRPTEDFLQEVSDFARLTEILR